MNLGHTNMQCVAGVQAECGMEAWEGDHVFAATHRPALAFLGLVQGSRVWLLVFPSPLLAAIGQEGRGPRGGDLVLGFDPHCSAVVLTVHPSLSPPGGQSPSSGRGRSPS